MQLHVGRNGQFHQLLNSRSFFVRRGRRSGDLARLFESLAAGSLSSKTECCRLCHAGENLLPFLIMSQACLFLSRASSFHWLRETEC